MPLAVGVLLRRAGPRQDSTNGTVAMVISLLRVSGDSRKRLVDVTRDGLDADKLVDFSSGEAKAKLRKLTD